MASRVQKLFVMRHGERLDDADPLWVSTPGVRTWDPPLTAKGTEQAMAVGEKLRSEGVEITRILVSPFLRCVQTTAGFIKGMYPEGTDISKLKVSALRNFYLLELRIRLRLCERNIVGRNYGLLDPSCNDKRQVSTTNFILCMRISVFQVF